MATKYRPLSEDIDDPRLSSFDIDDKDTLLAKDYDLPKHDKRPPYTIWVLAALLAVSLCCNGVALFWRRSSGNLDDICSLHTSQNLSPLTQGVKISYETRRFNSTFVGRTPYTEDPSPEVDAAWRALGSTSRRFIIPENEATKWGIDPGYAKYDPSFGGGYPVLFEFEHHLHCINILRASLFWNYEYYAALGVGTFAHEPAIHKQHAYHCVDMMRQVIMCQPDTGVFGQYWISKNDTVEDFRTEHKCKNFGALRDFVVGHQVSEEFVKEAKLGWREGDVVLDGVP